MIRLDAAFLKAPLAHRGLHDVQDGRPENSRAAIQAAISAGYGIEIDLQLSKDHQAMVFHDYDLARLTTAKGLVNALDAVSLKAISLKGGAEGIPTFSEVLELVAGRVPLLVELKDQDGQMGKNIGPLEEAAAQCLVDYGGPVALMSFNPHSVKRLSSLCPNIACGLVTSAFDPKAWAPLDETVCDHLRDIPDYDHVGASFISHEMADLDRPRVQNLKSKGANILCWTVKSPEAEAQARRVAENVTFEQYLAPIPA